MVMILTLSRMTLSKVSFTDILRNDYWDHFDTFGKKIFILALSRITLSKMTL